MIDFLYDYFLCLLDVIILYIGFYVCFKEDRRKNIFLLVSSILVFAYLDHLITDVWVMNEWVCEISMELAFFIFLYINYPKNLINKLVYFLIIDCIGFFIIISIGVIVETIGSEFTTNQITISLSYHLFSLFFYACAGKLLRNRLKTLNENSIKEIFKALLIPCIIMTLLFELYFAIENHSWFNLILVLYIISFIFTIKTSIRLVVLTEKETKNKFIEKIILHSQEQMDKIDVYNKEVRKMKHDYKNHLIIINDLLEQNKVEELKEYTLELTNNVNKTESPEISGLLCLDAILNNKVNEHKDIKFIFEVSCKKCLWIEEVDLCSLVFNLLDNAIQEVIKHGELDKRINFVMKEQNGILLLKVSNPLSKKKNLISEKFDIVNHGLGLDIITSIVNKYNGEMEINQNESFTVEIIMNE